MRNMTINNEANKISCGKEGAIPAVVEAMRGHAGSAGVQEQGCMALYNITANAENKTRAKEAGAKEAAEAAMKAHSGNEKVVKEARDMLGRIG